MIAAAGALALTAVLTHGGVIAAQQRAGVHPISGRVYALPMGVQGADWLDRREREDEEEPDRALRVLRIPKGATVADVGAGSGYMTVRMAKIVGPTGRVYANDIQPGMLDLLQKAIAKAKLTNVTPILGAIDDPKLPAGELDLILMVDVYHEFSQPQQMLRKMREALKPGGRLVLLEYRGEDPAIPIRPEHKMTRAQAKLEVEAEGFTLTTVNNDLPIQHILIFTKP
jgi:ubiquinone/menaquinone biosynthesis C-methylase UbiE